MMKTKMFTVLHCDYMQSAFLADAARLMVGDHDPRS